MSTKSVRLTRSRIFAAILPAFIFTLAGMMFSCSFFFSSTALGQYPAPGTMVTPSATPPGVQTAQNPAASRAPIQSATPNSVNTQFPQNGVPQVPGATGTTMPTLNPYQSMQVPQTRAFNGPVQYGQHTPSEAPEKPFANYEAAPTFSPYMHLYRRDNHTGIDNYNLYVKPAMEAEKKRQNMQSQLNSVQQQQAQQRVQQQTQFNSNVGASTVGASYGQMNTGRNTNQPGASYGFSGSGPTVHVDAEARGKTDKEKMDEEAEADEEKEDEKKAAYFNPYGPVRRGVVRPHYEPAGK